MCVAVVGLLGLTSCGQGEQAAAPAPAASATQAVEPTTSPATTSVESSPEMTLDPEEAAAAEVVAFGKPQTTGKGTVVTVAAPVAFTTSATAARFKITVTAPKDQVIDPTTATFTASHNGELAEQVVDLDERSGLDEVWSLPRLRPGKTVSFSLGFVGEASGQWDLDLGATDRTLMWSSDGAK